MQAQQQELNELDLCDVLFPPNRRFNVLIERTVQIVSVHDAVHEAIEHTNHCTVAGRTKSGGYVSTEYHACKANNNNSKWSFKMKEKKRWTSVFTSVVVHMQERNVTEFLTHDEENLLKIEEMKKNVNAKTPTCMQNGDVCVCAADIKKISSANTAKREEKINLRYPVNRVISTESTNTSQILDASQGHSYPIWVLDRCMLDSCFLDNTIHQ